MKKQLKSDQAENAYDKFKKTLENIYDDIERLTYIKMLFLNFKENYIKTK